MIDNRYEGYPKEIAIDNPKSRLCSRWITLRKKKWKELVDEWNRGRPLTMLNALWLVGYKKPRPDMMENIEISSCGLFRLIYNDDDDQFHREFYRSLRGVIHFHEKSNVSNIPRWIFWLSRDGTYPVSNMKCYNWEINNFRSKLLRI